MFRTPIDVSFGASIGAVFRASINRDAFEVDPANTVIQPDDARAVGHGASQGNGGAPRL